MKNKGKINVKNSLTVFVKKDCDYIRRIKTPENTRLTRIKIMKNKLKQISVLGLIFFAAAFCLLVQTGAVSGQTAKPQTSSTPISKPADKKPAPVKDDYSSADLEYLLKLAKENKELNENRKAAKELYDKKNYQGAIKILTKLIESNFLDIIDLESRAKCYLKVEDYKNALTDINASMLYSDKGSAQQLTVRGDIYRKQKDFSKAMADYDQAVKIDPKFADVYDSRGYLYALQGLYDAALADCNNAVKLNPKSSTAFAHRGYVYAKKYRIAEAAIDFRTAVELDPRNFIAAYNLKAVYSDDEEDEDGQVLSDEEYYEKKSKVFYI